MVDLINILLAIIGAMGGFIWLFEKYKHWVKDKSFWKLYNLKKEEKIILVIPTGGKCFDKGLSNRPNSTSSPNIITTVEDSMAKGTILSALLDKGFEVDIRLHSQLSEQEKAEHLFLICGPVGNLISRELLSRKDVPFHYRLVRDGVWKITDADGNVVHPDVDYVTKDYAIVAKLSNPWSFTARPRYIFFAAGIEGLGTWGAASILCKDFVKIVRYLEGPCDVKGTSRFVGVVAVTKHGNNTSPTVEINGLKAI